jgi:hypothetical protein
MTALAEDVRTRLPILGVSNDVAPFVFTEPTVTPGPLVEGDNRPYVDVIISQVISDTGTVAAPEIQQAYVGKIQRARRAMTPGRQWIGGGYFFIGAEVNPLPVHDHHYRMLEDPFALIRYDANHDRWWIIKGAGETPWPAGDDDYYSVTPNAYFEVRYDGAVTNLDAVELATNETPGHPVLSVEQTARFVGKAVTNEQGRAVQVTEFEDYTLYVGYSDARFNDTRQSLWFGLKAGGQDELLHWGRWQNLYGGSTMAPELTDTRPDDMVWAKAVVAEPTPYGLSTPESIRTTTQQRINGFESFNDALNDLARTQSWCGEYERVMGEVGMRSRRSGRIRLYADVIVDLNVEVDSPRYQVSNVLESDYEVDSVSNLRFDARVTVPVEFVLDRDLEYDDGYDEDLDADDYISSSMVSDAVESRVGNLSYTVEDYTIDGGVMLADNQDDLD